MRRLILFVALLVVAAPVVAGVCSLTAGKDQSCQFATDSTGGVAIYSNPTNLTTVGSGQIFPFLTTQNNGTEAGFSTDQPKVNLLPLDDKRDNSKTFTNTMTENNIGIVTVAGINYIALFLDSNEPDGGTDPLLSLDTLKIYDTGSHAAFLGGGSETLAQLDATPGFTKLYDLGAGNSLLLDSSLFKGSGLGFDMSLLIPVSIFLGHDPNDRIVVATQFGLSGGTIPGAGTADGFEEWHALLGAVPPPPPPPIPEPAPLALLAIAVLGMGFIRQHKPK